MGLYSKNVMDAFNPPFNKLNGRKAGSNNSTTASLGYPVKAAICQMEAARTVPERTIQTEAETKTITMTAAKKNITNVF